ncbi:galactose oxidase [Peniophora sp. CONT]|nr:galactose oxidase [Peniophora sp. CONT]
MHSVSDLTTFSRPTSGDVPPKLVGASTTVVGSKVYLYGGRLVTERRMVTDMWLFDLNTLVWRRLEQSAEEDLPASRYFHSADAWDNYLVIFGGMGINPEAEDTSDELLVLSDVRFFDLRNNRWMSSAWSTNQLQESQIAPKPRYAHLSSISGSRLFVIGGQDLNNVWLDDVYVYDLYRRGWVSAHDYPRHCGTYRSVAVAGSLRVRVPLHEQQRNATPTAKPVFSSDGRPSSSSTPQTSSDALIHLPYSAAPTDEFPTDIYLYSNYNFTDVKRELEVFSPRPGSGFDITDHSSSMVGTSFPPGLRFPSGAILGHHLIIAGTYLAHSFQSSSVWALNLHDMTWSRIDPGSTLSTGSWFRTALWADANKFGIFGNRAGNLVDDYNRRLLSWDDVALIDLEAFGIYQPPKLELELRMQEIGLAALEEGVLADFEVICDDDRRIRCSRKLLDERWPWFREQRKIFLAAAQRALEAIPMSAQDGPAPELPGGPRPDPRLSPRSLALSEPYPVTLALLQYFYSMALLTPLQHAPPVLSALLVIATNYNITHLQALVKHAMHRALSNSTSVGVYEVATLCSCRSLQISSITRSGQRVAHGSRTGTTVAPRVPPSRAMVTEATAALHLVLNHPALVLAACLMLNG